MIRFFLLSTTALIIAGSISAAAGHRTAKGRPELPKGVIAVTSREGIPTTVILTSLGQNDRQSAAKGLVPLLDAGTTFSNLSKDRNAEFLSWYGFLVSAYSNSSCSSENCSYSSGYERMAIPIKGKGKAVTTIKIPVARAGSSSGFTVGLYSNATSSPGADGAPGKQLAGTSASATRASGYCCAQLATVTIPATMLDSGKTYWVVEDGIRQNGRLNRVAWLAEDTDYTGQAKALMQYHTYSGSTISGNHRVNIDYTSPWQSVGDWTQPAAEVQ
ncbi:MAG TPA: hypothetical protein VGF97_09960 [Rhizomicrobium sp.]|jgi:hypothetical protein